MLWPEGVSTATEAPIDLLRAINHANKVLDWFENLMSEEVPPEWMWPFDEEISDWFDEVKQARKDRYSSGNADIDGEDFMENDLSEGR